MRFTYEVDRNWFMTFQLLGKTAIVTASNIHTNERLTMPDDFKKLCGLLPLDMWPQFARPQLNKKATKINQSEGLF